MSWQAKMTTSVDSTKKWSSFRRKVTQRLCTLKKNCWCRIVKSSSWKDSNSNLREICSKEKDTPFMWSARSSWMELRERLVWSWMNLLSFWVVISDKKQINFMKVLKHWHLFRSRIWVSSNYFLNWLYPLGKIRPEELPWQTDRKLTAKSQLSIRAHLTAFNNLTSGRSIWGPIN